MDIWKLLLRLWAVLTLASIAIDGGCLWLDQHGAIAGQLLARYGVNYITVFLWSAPVPFVFALLVPALGTALTLARWMLAHSVGLLHFHHGPMHGLR